MKLKLPKKIINLVDPKLHKTVVWQKMINSWKGYFILGLAVSTIEVFVSCW